MLADVKKQQSVLTRSLAISGAAVKASYIIAEKKSVASKPRINEELGEKCLLKFAEILCTVSSQTQTKYSEILPEKSCVNCT